MFSCKTLPVIIELRRVIAILVIEFLMWGNMERQKGSSKLIIIKCLPPYFMDYIYMYVYIDAVDENDFISNNIWCIVPFWDSLTVQKAGWHRLLHVLTAPPTIQGTPFTKKPTAKIAFSFLHLILLFLWCVFKWGLLFLGKLLKDDIFLYIICGGN